VSRTRQVFVAVIVLVAASLAAGSAQAASPGENGRIAFTMQTGTRIDIFSAEPDGNALAQLTNDGKSTNPAFSPDGTRLAFTSGTQVYVGDQYANNPQLVLDMGVGTWKLDWSPDGTRLVGAFPSCDSCESDIYVFEADGGGLINLTNTIAPEYNPSWSPDGDRIAFDSLRSGAWDVYTIEADGGGELNVTGDLAGEAKEPDWAPDGSKLAFEAHIPSYGVSVWSANPDGSGKERVLTAPSGAFEPAWSPDGRQFAYSDPVFGDRQYRAIRVTGPHTGYYRPYFGFASAQDPDWQVRQPEPSPPPANGTGYVRPAGATPVYVPLVPGYKECRIYGDEEPYRRHGAPLSHPSCEPNFYDFRPVVVGTPDVNGKPAIASGFARFQVIAGDPETVADEADVRIRVHQTDLRIWRSPYADATGTLVIYTDLRVTDTRNDGGGTDGSATVVDHRLYAGAPCVSTAGPEGATCSLETSADAITPGLVREGRRAIWELGQVRAYHSFTLGDPHIVNDQVMFTQGLFVP
jgi:TolB protein